MFRVEDEEIDEDEDEKERYQIAEAIGVAIQGEVQVNKYSSYQSCKS